MPESIPPVFCPAHPFTVSVLQSTAQLAKALTCLKRSMRTCSRCALRCDCPIMTEFNAKFQIALAQVTDEWQLT